MTVWNIPQIASIWERNGGSLDGVVAAVAVALAESGGNDQAVSPSADYGLWQINAANFGAYAVDWNNWNDPDASARTAIAMSNNGSNWAPWCTAWTDPGDNCGHGFLPYPQPGSAAGNNTFTVAQWLNAVGSINTALVPVAAPNSMQASDAWDRLRGVFGSNAQDHWRLLDTVQFQLGRL